MTLTHLLIRFTGLYLLCLFVAGVALHYAGLSGGGLVNTAILMGCVVWVCHAFGRRNKRYFSGAQKAVVVVGVTAINFLLQVLVVALAAALQPSPEYAGLGTVALAVGVVSLIHAVGVYAMIWAVGRALARQGIGSTQGAPGA
jgi:hypothetical protein